MRYLCNDLHRENIQYETDVPLRKLTGFKTGGSATLVAWPKSRDELVTVLDIWRSNPCCPITVIGKGSNTLFPDDNYNGLVIVTTHANHVVFEEDETPACRDHKDNCYLYAECGVSLTTLCRDSLKRSLSGLEFAYGCPGTVGGALLLNIEGYNGTKFESLVIGADYYDVETGKIRTIDSSDMVFSYRHSAFQDHPDWVLLGIILEFKYDDGTLIQTRIKDALNKRMEQTPLEYPALLAFDQKEPSSIKGLIGCAEISRKNGCFIVNRGGATSSDVMNLLKKVHFPHYISIVDNKRTFPIEI